MGIKVGRILLAIARPLAWILFPFKLIGKVNIPYDRPLVICCNHISALDPLFLLYGCRRPIYFMGKEELFKNPLAAWFLKRLFGVFAVNRGAGDKSVIDQAVAIVQNGDMMGIFPEGTRSKDGTLGRAKSGAALIVAQSGVDVLPCAVFAKDGGKVRLFHRVYVVYGTPASPEELHLTGEKPELRYASRAIMAAIAALIEENRV